MPTHATSTDCINLETIEFATGLYARRPAISCRSPLPHAKARALTCI